MSEENEDGWSTINTSPDNKKEAPPVIEFEDSKGDPVAPPESTQVELEIVQEEQSTEKESQEPEELQGINTKGAEKRIRKLVAQRKERDEQLTLAMDKIRYLEGALCINCEFHISTCFFNLYTYYGIKPQKCTEKKRCKSLILKGK